MAVVSIDEITLTSRVPRLDWGNAVRAALSGIRNVSMAGATGDGTTDDSQAFTDAEAEGYLTYIPRPSAHYDLLSTISTTDGAWLPDPTSTWAEFGDSGQLDMHRGHFTGAGNGVNIWRFADRVFVGEAASEWAAVTDTVPDAGDSWFADDADGPAFLGVNAQLLVISPENSDSGGRYAIVGAAKTSSSTGAGAIGVAGAVINAKASADAWALYADITGQSTSNQTFGLEIAAKNQRSSDSTMGVNAQTSGVFGLWLAGGGDSAYGGSSSHPSTAGIVLLQNDNTWNTGIVVMEDALTDGRVMALASEGTGGAHYFAWYDSSNNEVFILRSAHTGSTAYAIVNDNNGINFTRDTNIFFRADGPASTVNNVLTFGAATGNYVQVVAEGSDTDIDLALVPQGAGVLRFGSFTSIGSEILAGYITIKDSGGTSRKVAVIA